MAEGVLEFERIEVEIIVNLLLYSSYSRAAQTEHKENNRKTGGRCLTLKL